MLLDHFHPPLLKIRHWSGFHGAWATNIAVDLNRHLPEGWFAEPTVQWGIEVDVATFEDSETLVTAGTAGRGSGTWEPDEPIKTIDFSLTTDIVEVKIYRDEQELPLAGVIELVSPANKDRPETRETFTSKCNVFLHQGVGLVLVDLVTKHQANLHSQLMDRINEPDQQEDPIYTAAYHPVKRNGNTKLDIWYEPLAIGDDLISMPLFLKNGPRARVNLADTYLQTLKDLRYPVDHTNE